MKLRTLLAGLALVVLASVGPALADSLPVVADTQVNLTAVAAKGGSLATTTVKNTSPGAAYRAFARFDLSALPTGLPVTKATLRLWASAVTTPGNLDVAAVLGPWEEANLTALTAPSLSESITDFSVEKANLKNYVSIDITPLVADWVSGALPNHGLALLGQPSRPVNVRFDTKENLQSSHPMELEVVLGLPPGSGDITAIVPGFGLTGGGNLGDVSLAVNPATIQRRVTGSCAAGSSVRLINSDGTVSCQTDSGSAGFRDFDSAFSTTVPGAGTFVYGCKVSAYTAGPGERAFVWAHASCSATPVGAGIGVRVGYNTGGADNTLGSWHYQKNTGTVAGDMSNGQHATLALSSGTTYVFSTAITNSNNSATWSSNCYCHTMVQIVR